MQKEQEKKAIIEGSSLVAKTVGSSNYITEAVYENLPEPLKEITNEFTDRERDIILLSSIGVISACLPNTQGNYDSRVFNPNLYVFIIAPPASGKGVMDWSKLLITPIHEEKKKQYEQKLEEYKNNSSDENSSEPVLKAKVIPGNVSNAKCYQHLSNAEDSLLIFESEADSLSNMLKQDWGDFSDLMRKAFQHETCSISRSDRFSEVTNPKLSIVLSGTPNQIQPLINSKENGLFSRFMYYFFDEVQGWKDVSPNPRASNKEELFSEKGEQIKELYDKLLNIKVEVVMNPEQWDIFNKNMKEITDIFLDKKNEFLSVIKRLGLICFRLIMIFTVLRNREFIQDESIQLEACNEDVNTGLALTNYLVDNSLKVFDMYDKKSVKMTVKERLLYQSLPQKFKSSKGFEIAIKNKIAKRTFSKILKKWQKEKLVIKIAHGEYEKFDEKS